MRKVFLVSALVSSMVLAAGCETMDINKQQAGTFIGGLGGALLGSQVGGGSGKVLATLIGGAAGAYLGNQIGGMLDERDRQALALQTQQALNASMADSGATASSWSSGHSGASAQISQGVAYEEQKPVEVKRIATVQAVPNMKLIQAPYVTMKNSNVRAAPSMNADKVGGLQPGTEFTAVGSSGDWVLVGRKGVTVGYVHSSLVEPKAKAVAKKAAPSINLDDINVAASSETRGFDLDSLPTASSSVAASSTCRPVSINLTSADGKTASEQSTYCKQSNGTWELI